MSLKSYEVFKTILFLLVLLLSLTSCTSKNELINIKVTNENLNKKESNADKSQNSENVTITLDQVLSKINGSPYLDNAHYQNEIKCESCHGQLKEGEQVNIPEMKVCLDCHGSYQDLGEKLKEKEQWKNYNPHYSAHGEDACITCHKSHKPFELTCSGCHNIGPNTRFQ